MELCKLGYLVIQKDENIIFYIPPVVTPNQYRYLLENKHSLKKFSLNLHAYSIFLEDGKFYHDGLNELLQEYENGRIDILYQEIKKKYLPCNNSYVLIIPNEEQLQIENGVYYQEFDSNLLEGHGKIYQVFCMKNQIMIYISDGGGYFWGKELSDKNIMSVIKEDDELYIFIPRKLSKNQYQWFENKKEYLMSFKHLEAGVWLAESYQEIYQNESHQEQKSELELIEKIYCIVENKKPVAEIKK